MSGYRSLHRERIHTAPIWDVQALRIGNNLSILTASGDGLVRWHQVNAKDVNRDTELNAAALSLTCSHYFVGKNQVIERLPEQTVLGTSQISVIRNYVGDDDAAGDLVVASLDLSGRVRVWTCTTEDLAEHNEEVKSMKVLNEFMVENATGTLMTLCPPNLIGNGDVLVAVALLDGSITMLATGLSTPKAKYESKEAGTWIQSIGCGSIAMSLAWHPTNATLAVGRKDGLVEILPISKQGSHRLIQHDSKVRAVCFTPDGQLLVSASDDGMLAVWDVNRKSPTLVHHVVKAHSSWILAVTPLGDSRRFLTAGADGALHVWSIGQIHTPLHTFQTTEQMWTIDASRDRLVIGSEHGWLQIYSLEDK